ncbi:MAG: DUF4250 domain-containing protein [Cellulosilyticaceae bacterium]
MNILNAKDPYVMFSLINTKLRDECESLEKLCDIYEIDQIELVGRMESIGYTYNSHVNQFTK